MPLPALRVSSLAARRFVRRTLLLDKPVPDVAAALNHLGYVQIDPINVCGRMHDLILRNRVRGYREGDLMRHIHGDRTRLPPAERVGFEHHMPGTQQILVAFALEAWPHLLAAMHARSRRPGAWSGRFTPRERELVPKILTELAARGPLGSEDLHDGTRARRHVWGSATLAKRVLQKLFFHGRVLIAARDGARRLYDLPERVLPAATLALPEPPANDTARWLAILKLRQRRLVTLKRTEFPHVEDLVQPVAIENCPPLYCLREDVPLLEAAASELSTPAPTASAAPPLLLAPLDPLIYDRRVTAALWNFDYTWEVYTPPHKRVRGYYALPILSGLELVGHADLKADRERRKLVTVGRSVRRGHRAVPAILSLARWLGLR